MTEQERLERERQELNTLRKNSPAALPDNPGAAGWSSGQIKDKFSAGLFYLYSLLSNTRNSSEMIDVNSSEELRKITEPGIYTYRILKGSVGLLIVESYGRGAVYHTEIERYSEGNGLLVSYYEPLNGGEDWDVTRGVIVTEEYVNEYVDELRTIIDDLEGDTKDYVNEKLTTAIQENNVEINNTIDEKVSKRLPMASVGISSYSTTLEEIYNTLTEKLGDIQDKYIFMDTRGAIAKIGLVKINKHSKGGSGVYYHIMYHDLNWGNGYKTVSNIEDLSSITFHNFINDNTTYPWKYPYATEDFVNEQIELLKKEDFDINQVLIFHGNQLTKKADISYVDTRVANLVNSAPETLDTIGELATALQENKDVVNAVNQSIATKANKADVETLSATVQATKADVETLSATVQATKADVETLSATVQATKADVTYVDDQIASRMPILTIIAEGGTTLGNVYDTLYEKFGNLFERPILLKTYGVTNFTGFIEFRNSGFPSVYVYVHNIDYSSSKTARIDNIYDVEFRIFINDETTYPWIYPSSSITDEELDEILV